MRQMNLLLLDQFFAEYTTLQVFNENILIESRVFVKSYNL